MGQFIGETRIAPPHLLGNDSKSLGLEFRIEHDAAEFLGNADGAQADFIGRLQQFQREPRVGIEQPLTLRITAYERMDYVIDEFAAGLPHQDQLFRHTKGLRFHFLSPPLFAPSLPAYS